LQTLISFRNTFNCRWSDWRSRCGSV